MQFTFEVDIVQCQMNSSQIICIVLACSWHVLACSNHSKKQQYIRRDVVEKHLIEKNNNLVFCFVESSLHSCKIFSE